MVGPSQELVDGWRFGQRDRSELVGAGRRDPAGADAGDRAGRIGRARGGRLLLGSVADAAKRAVARDHRVAGRAAKAGVPGLYTR